MNSTMLQLSYTQGVKAWNSIPHNILISSFTSKPASTQLVLFNILLNFTLTISSYLSQSKTSSKPEVFMSNKVHSMVLFD